MTNSFFPYSHLHSSGQGAAGLENCQASSGRSKALGFAASLNSVSSPAPPCCLIRKPRSGEAMVLPWHAGDATVGCCGAGTPQNWAASPRLLPTEGRGLRLGSLPSGAGVLHPCRHKAALSSPEYCPPLEEFRATHHSSMRLGLHRCYISYPWMISVVKLPGTEAELR